MANGNAFTPGPLHVRKAPSNCIPPFYDVEREDEPGCIARVFPSDTAEADATLYATAPELLRQLEFAVKLLSAFPSISGTAQIGSMRDTIAKAKGQITLDEYAAKASGGA